MATGAGFAQELQEELDRHDLSARAFARLYAAQEPSQSPETARRTIGRWLSGETAPRRPSRIRAARSLGLPDERFLDTESARPLALLEELAALRRSIDALLEHFGVDVPRAVLAELEGRANRR